MTQTHTEQLLQDLETLRSVVGTELPFDKTDAKLSVAVGLAALVPAIVGFVGVKSPFLLLASSGLFLAVLAASLIRGYRSTHPSKSCSRSKRLEYRPGIWSLLGMVFAIGGYHWWARSLNVPSGVVGGTVLMFLGVIIMMGAAIDPKRSAGLCAAIPAIIGGLLWPHLEYFQFWTLLWALVGLGMVSSGILMLRQLRGQEFELTSEES